MLIYLLDQPKEPRRVEEIFSSPTRATVRSHFREPKNLSLFGMQSFLWLIVGLL